MQMNSQNKIVFAVCILYPGVAYASGMEGLGYIVMYFLFLLITVPGGIVKIAVALKGKEIGNLKIVPFAMFIEGTSLYFCVMFCYRFFAQLDPSADHMTWFIPTVIMYPVFAFFPNLLFLKRKDKRLIKVVLNLKYITLSVLLSLITPFCFYVSI